MSRSQHQTLGEFYLRGPIAGLAVLNGNLTVRNSIENASPANAATVIAALRAAVALESPYVNIHKADYFRIRGLIDELWKASAPTGREGGDSASNVADAVRSALNANAAITALFLVGGSGANITLTQRSRTGNDATLNIAYANGTATGLTPSTTSVDTTAGVASVAQVETATIASGASADGNLQVTVTSAGMTGSPLVILVPILSTDNTAALVAAKVRTVLGQNATITGRFAVGGSSATVTLTRLNPDGVGNDGTLNIAVAGNGTGVTDAGTSANTTAGVAGTAQVETQTIVGTPTTDGNITVTVTAAGLTGSPITVQVPVNGSQNTGVIITDALYAAAKASSDPAEQVLRASLVTLAINYIPYMTTQNAAGLLNAGRF